MAEDDDLHCHCRSGGDLTVSVFFSIRAAAGVALIFRLSFVESSSVGISLIISRHPWYELFGIYLAVRRAILPMI